MNAPMRAPTSSIRTSEIWLSCANVGGCSDVM
jgi:hypothetical protein